MNHYWAKFKKQNEDLFRFDTRVYLQPIDKPLPKDICIGAFIGKNPGSAKPSDINNKTLQPIDLGNDKFLPIIKNLMIRAHEEAGIILDNNPNKFIQVLNLFYLCDNNLNNAIARIRQLPKPPICPSENNSFKFIFYSWGGSNTRINDLKNRFINNPNTTNNIWYDYKYKKVINDLPQINDSVKHLQGLSHDAIVHDIAKILKKVK